MQDRFHARSPLMKPRPGARLNPSHPATAGLVGCWLMNEQAGGSLYNLVSQVGSSLGSTNGWSPTPLGTAVSFAGASTSGITTPITTAFTDFTCMVWFNDNTPINFERLVDKNFSAGFWVGRNGTTNQWGGGVLESSSPFGVFVSLSNNALHQLVSRRTGTTHDIIADGGAVTASNTVSGSALDATAVRFGMANDTSSFYDGLILMVLLWNRAVPDPILRDLYLDPYGFLAPSRSVFLATGVPTTGSIVSRRTLAPRCGSRVAQGAWS